MTVRADQALIAGVALIGAYAAYRLFLSSTAPSPAPKDAPPPVLPPPGQPFDQNVVEANGSATLRKGYAYRGRLDGNAADPPSALRSYGLEPLEIHASAADARAAGFLEPALESPREGTVWFTARFDPGDWFVAAAGRVMLKQPGAPFVSLLWPTANAPPKVRDAIGRSSCCAYVDHNAHDGKTAVRLGVPRCHGLLSVFHDARGCRPVCAAHRAWRSRLSQAAGHSRGCPSVRPTFSPYAPYAGWLDPVWLSR